MTKVKRIARLLFDVRTIYALIGIILSIIAHEIFHMLVHFGQITAVHIFPDLSTIVALELVHAPTDSQLLYEELAAYGITAIILLITVIDVLAIHDSRNHKPLREELLHNEPVFADFDDAAIAKALGLS